MMSSRLFFLVSGAHMIDWKPGYVVLFFVNLSLPLLWNHDTKIAGNVIQRNVKRKRQINKKKLTFDSEISPLSWRNNNNSKSGVMWQS